MEPWAFLKRSPYPTRKEQEQQHYEQRCEIIFWSKN